MEASELTRGTVTTREIVAKLWNLCHVLRDDGITYQDYVTELTFLLFLKMLAETGHEERLANGYRWSELARRDGMEQLTYYRRLLLDLGDPKKTRDATVLAIFTDAQTKLRKPTNLKSLTTDIDRLDWFSARQEGLGDLYEGLLERNANEKKSGAGQYFTPRPLIDCIVRLMKPKPGEVIRTRPLAQVDLSLLQIATSRMPPTIFSSCQRRRRTFNATMPLRAPSWCTIRTASSL
jgi:type I restriction enzyme M protein